MEKFKEYNLSLAEKDKSLVISYLSKVKKIVDKYNIEKELYIDIEDMVFEKLSNSKELNQLSITRILKEVGEPEIIFSDYIENTSNENNSGKKIGKESNKIGLNESEIDETLFYENMIKKGWVRDNNKALVLGISNIISRKIKLPVLIVRILFILLTFAGGLGFYIYVILGILLPIEGIDYKGINTLGFLKIQFKYFIKDSIINTVKTIKKYTLLLIEKILFISKKIMKHIIPILRFIFFAFIAFIFSVFFILLIVIGSLYFSNISINNIDYMSVFPSYFIWGVITGIYSLGVFMIAFFLYSISGKWINKYVLTSGFVAFIISIFFISSTSFHLVQMYSGENKITQTLEIELNEINDKNIIFDMNDIVNFQGNSPFYSYRGNSSVTLVNSKEKKLKVEIQNDFLGNEEIYKKFSEALIEPQIINLDGKIKIENPKMFSRLTPPTLMKREIIISIPEGHTIKFDNYAPYLYYITNAHLSYNQQLFSQNYNVVNPNCGERVIWYSMEQGDFICELTDEEIKLVKKERLKRFVMVNFDSISSLRHKNEHKRSYWNDGVGGTLDWRFENFYWVNNELINFEFSDMSLDVRASLKINEVDDKIEISDFTINHVEVHDYIFKPIYYEDITPIKKFLGNSINMLDEDNYDNYEDIINNINNTGSGNENINNSEI